MADHHSHHHESSSSNSSSSSTVKVLLLQEEEDSRPQKPRCQTWCARTRNSSSSSFSFSSTRNNNVILTDNGRGLLYNAADDNTNAKTSAAARPRFLSWGIPLSPISLEQQQQQDIRHPKNSSSSSSSSSHVILSFEDEDLNNTSSRTSSDDDNSNSGGSSDDLSILSSNNDSSNRNRNQHRNLPYYALSRYWKGTSNTKKNSDTYESGDEEGAFDDEEHCYTTADNAAMEDIEAPTTNALPTTSSRTTVISEQEPEDFPLAPLEKRHLRVPSVTSTHFKHYSQGKSNPLHVPPIMGDPYLFSPDRITSDILMGECTMTSNSHKNKHQHQQQQPAAPPCYHYTPSILSYKSILFPKMSKSRDRNCNTYMFSIVVGAIVMFVFAIYVILAIV